MIFLSLSVSLAGIGWGNEAPLGDLHVMPSANEHLSKFSERREKVKEVRGAMASWSFCFQLEKASNLSLNEVNF